MQENLKEILSHLSPDVDQEVLMQYLEGKLSATQQHEVEKQMMDNEFTADALEGLQNFKDQKRLNYLVDQLQRDLKKKTEKKKASREKRKIQIEPWLLITLLIFLLLVIISFLIIHQMRL